jgi:hypothetical protein
VTQRNGRNSTKPHNAAPHSTATDRRGAPSGVSGCEDDRCLSGKQRCAHLSTNPVHRIPDPSVRKAMQQGRGKYRVPQGWCTGRCNGLYLGGCT